LGLTVGPNRLEASPWGCGHLVLGCQGEVLGWPRLRCRTSSCSHQTLGLPNLERWGQI